MVGVYKITSPSGKIYIGSSCNIEERFYYYKSLHCRSQKKLYHSFLKYGVDKHKFEVIEECAVDKVRERELYYGIMFDVLNPQVGLNCRLPKEGEAFSYMCEETKRKIGETNRIRQTGKKISFYYKSSLKKLTEEEVKEIKILLSEGILTQKEIGDKYGVSRAVIKNICIGKTYKYVLPNIDLSKRVPTYYKLTNDDVRKIRELAKIGKYTYTEIARIYGVNESHISRIINNINRKENVRRFF